jgi:ABC-2 type transport system permease protein
VVPLACVAYYPVVALLEVDDPLGTDRVFQMAAPGLGVMFLLASFLLWRIGVRRYTSTGS